MNTLDPILLCPHLNIQDIGKCEQVCSFWKEKISEQIWREQFDCYFQGVAHDPEISWRDNCKFFWIQANYNISNILRNVVIVIGDNWYDYELQIFGDIFDQMNDLEWSLFQHHIWKHKEENVVMLHLRLVQIMNFSSKSRTEGFLRRLAETSKDLEVQDEAMDVLIQKHTCESADCNHYIHDWWKEYCKNKTKQNETE